jgi:transcriptional regulator with XRE-family HTH domain
VRGCASTASDADSPFASSRAASASPASALSQIELGKSQPTLKTLCGLVDELGISFDELLSR